MVPLPSRELLAVRTKDELGVAATASISGRPASSCVSLAAMCSASAPGVAALHVLSSAEGVWEVCETKSEGSPPESGVSTK